MGLVKQVVLAPPHNLSDTLQELLLDGTGHLCGFRVQLFLHATKQISAESP